MKIIFISGASGAGKTSLLESLKKNINNFSIAYLHFDSLGVPSEKEMVNKHGSPSEWQKAMTYLWINKIKHEYFNKSLVILEGQINLSFIVNACEENEFLNYKIILMHCDDSARHKRLRDKRNQPELINENMNNWANFLKQQAINMQIPIIDTTSMTKEDMVNIVLNHFKDDLNG